jgi:outer membrane autotransporter protein
MHSERARIVERHWWRTFHFLAGGNGAMNNALTGKSLLLVLLLLTTLGVARNAAAAQIDVTCSDVSDPQTCRVSGGAVSDSLADLVDDVLASLSNATETGACTRNGNTAQCVLGTQTLNCAIADDELSSSCQLGELPPEYFSLNCNRNETGGACTFASDETAINAALVPALGPRRAAFATHLLAACALRSGTDAYLRDCDPLLSALGNGQFEQVLRTLDAIIPVNADITLDNTALQIAQQLNGVRARLSRLRHGKQGVDVAGLMFFDGMQWVSAGTLLASNNESVSDVSPPASSFGDDERLGVFIDGSFGNTERDTTENEGEAETDLQLLTLGIDYRLSDQWIAGVAYSASFSSTDYGNDAAGNKRGDLDSNGYLLIGYGTWYQGDAYVEATLAYGADRFEQTRRARCQSGCPQVFEQAFEADFQGSQVAATIGGGYEWRFGEFGITPWLQLASTQLDVDGYRETPDSPEAAGAGYALTIDDMERDLLTASLGADLRYTKSMAWGVLVPYLSVELINELDDDDSVVTGRFTGNLASDDGFSLANDEVDTSYAQISIGTTWQLAGGQGGYFDVRSLQGYDDVDQWQVTAGWRFAF